MRLAQPGLDIGPAQFVPYLESGPLSLAFGRRVAEMAVEAGKRFQRAFEKAKEEGSASDTSTLADDTGLFRLSFNVSPRQMTDHFWVPFLSSTFEQAGLTGEAFELELTETSRALSTERLAAWIEACRCLGLTWALDDFGTGYNGIDVMLKGHFDTVKFDRAFLCQALSDADAEAFLAHLIEACRTSGAAIGVCPAPRAAYVPLSQHIGAPAVPAVEAGERVLRGQLLAKKAEGISANVYSPVAGVVKGVVGHIAGGGKKVDHILIESDGTDESVSLPPLSEITPESARLSTALMIIGFAVAILILIFFAVLHYMLTL